MANSNRFTTVVQSIIAAEHAKTSIGPLNLDSLSHNAEALLMFANDVDLAASQLAHALADVQHNITRDLEKAQRGLRIDNALSASTARDINEHRVQLEERSRALRIMIRLVFGKEARSNFDEAIENSTKS